MNLKAKRDAAALVTRDGAMCFRAMRVQERAADFVASTDAVDSHGDIVDQESWQLEHFKSNPVVLYGHNSRELPIGQATSVAVRNGQLEATIKFASAEANPRAEEVWRLVQEGVLRAVSVGFLPTDGRYEVRDGGEVFVWRSPILKEISVVPVPANHEALARMKAAFAAEHNSETPALPGPHPSNAEKESLMDLKELEAKVATQTASIAELTAENKSLKTEKAALEAQNKSLVEARDKALEKADKLEEAVIEQEVEALVGDKIKPSEKTLFVDLRKQNKELFTKMIEQREPMKLSQEITPKEKGVTKTRTVGGGTDDIVADIINQAVNG